MPEGHTIHGLARRHRKLFSGTQVRAGSPQGRFADEASVLDGQVLVSTEARGKHLFYGFEDGEVLHVHLGLIGVFRTFTEDPPEPTPATRLAINNETATAYLSGPMTCELIDRGAQKRIIAGLGPDPLHNRTDAAGIVAALSRRSIPIGAALLDQSIISGLGNVYRSELLFICGIDPRREARSLNETEVEGIWEAAKEQLRIGIRAGRIVTVDPADLGAANRGMLGPDDRLYVYHRDELPCRRCGTTIRKTAMGGRAVWFCPEEQH
jgi:endonuclease-8